MSAFPICGGAKRRAPYFRFLLFSQIRATLLPGRSARDTRRPLSLGAGSAKEPLDLLLARPLDQKLLEAARGSFS